MDGMYLWGFLAFVVAIWAFELYIEVRQVRRVQRRLPPLLNADAYGPRRSLASRLDPCGRRVDETGNRIEKCLSALASRSGAIFVRGRCHATSSLW